MTNTNTQNRPYDSEELMVKATFHWAEHDLHGPETLYFNWNDRAEVRNFAAQSDRIIRAGGKTILERV